MWVCVLLISAGGWADRQAGSQAGGQFASWGVDEEERREHTGPAQHTTLMPPLLPPLPQKRTQPPIQPNPPPEHMSAAPMTSSFEWLPGMWSPTDCTMGRMTIAPTVWLIKVVPTSTRPQKMASTAHRLWPPTSSPMNCRGEEDETRSVCTGRGMSDKHKVRWGVRQHTTMGSNFSTCCQRPTALETCAHRHNGDCTLPLATQPTDSPLICSAAARCSALPAPVPGRPSPA